MVTTGTVLADRYEVQDLIASGGMGHVYAARDRVLERDVAVKTLRDSMVEHDDVRERFRREARAAAALIHPNIAAVYDFGEEDGQHFIVMERCHGRTLSEVIEQDGALEPARAAAIAAQIADALDHAHAGGLIHRDIKPSNVMVDDRDRAKVMDFGIARVAGDSTLTATGSVLGTAHYIAPEQAAGEGVTSRSDIYSLGVVLFHMLTGTAPFTGDSPISIAVRHVNETIPAPSGVATSVTPELDEVVARATAKDPQQRFADGAAMAAALRGTPAGAEATRELTHTVWPIPGTRWEPQRIGRTAIVAGLVLFLLAAALLTWSRGDDEPAGGGEKRRRAAAAGKTASAGDAAHVVVPDVIGWDHKEAAEVLKDLGLKVGEEKAPSELDKDLVFYTDPERGSEMLLGETITLFVSEGYEEDDDGDDDDDHPGKGNAYGRDKDD